AVTALRASAWLGSIAALCAAPPQASATPTTTRYTAVYFTRRIVRPHPIDPQPVAPFQRTIYADSDTEIVLIFSARSWHLRAIFAIIRPFSSIRTSSPFEPYQDGAV